tara:strand:- start:18689 stop:19936 length:1248 start_codon:yes stop_codon:yes gene_type:complete
VNKIKYSLSTINEYFLIILFLISPTYVVSQNSGEDKWIGFLSNYLNIPSLIWMIMIAIGLVLILITKRRISLYVLISLIVTIYSLYISIYQYNIQSSSYRTSLGLGIIWTIIIAISANIKVNRLKNIIYNYLSYFILINFIISLSQVFSTWPFSYFDSPLLRYGTQFSFRASGVYTTPHALSILSLFSIFVFISFHKKVISFNTLFIIISTITLFLSYTKSSITILIILLFISLLISIANSIGFRTSRNFLIISTGLFSSALIPIVAQIYSNSFSVSYKPAVFVALIQTFIQEPQSFIWGFDAKTFDIFLANLPSEFYFQESISMESWLIRIIVFYGLPYFLLLLSMLYVVRMNNLDKINKWFMNCAFYSLLSCSLVLNGGIQPPTSFFVFSIVGLSIASRLEKDKAKKKSFKPI